MKIIINDPVTSLLRGLFFYNPFPHVILNAAKNPAGSARTHAVGGGWWLDWMMAQRQRVTADSMSAHRPVAGAMWRAGDGG